MRQRPDDGGGTVDDRGRGGARAPPTGQGRMAGGSVADGCDARSLRIRKSGWTTMVDSVRAARRRDSRRPGWWRRRQRQRGSSGLTGKKVRMKMRC